MSDTSKLLVLGAIGVGVVLLVSQRRAPAVAGAAPPAGTSGGGPLASVLSVIEAGMALFSGARRTTATGSGFVGAGVQSGVPQWDDAYRRALAGGVVGEIAVNPVNTSVFDFGTGAGFGNQDYGAFL